MISSLLHFYQPHYTSLEWYTSTGQEVTTILSASKAASIPKSSFIVDKVSLEVVKEYGKNDASIGWGVKYTGAEALAGGAHVCYYLGTPLKSFLLCTNINIGQVYQDPSGLLFQDLYKKDAFGCIYNFFNFFYLCIIFLLSFFLIFYRYIRYETQQPVHQCEGLWQ